MRLSARRDDPGYDPALLKRNPRILVDGVAVANCVTADEEEGFATCLALNDQGVPYADPGTDEAALSTLRGKVKILLQPEADPSAEARRA